jgi:hypothetical protein
MQIKSLKKTIYQDEDVHFEVEEVDDWLALHCEVEHWSPSIYKRMIKIFGQFLNEAQKKGYEGLISFSPNPRFCQLFGGRSIGQLEYEGQLVEVVQWALRQQP